MSRHESKTGNTRTPIKSDNSMARDNLPASGFQRNKTRVPFDPKFSAVR
jgi:hypothetical protein